MCVSKCDLEFGKLFALITCFGHNSSNVIEFEEKQCFGWWMIHVLLVFNLKRQLKRIDGGWGTLNYLNRKRPSNGPMNA